MNIMALRTADTGAYLTWRGGRCHVLGNNTDKYYGMFETQEEAAEHMRYLNKQKTDE